MENLFRSLFLWLSGSRWLRQTLTQIPLAYRIASRFFAGETATEAIAAVRELSQAGKILATMDILGEETLNREDAQRSRDAYLALLDEIKAAGVVSDISLKLTQMGLDIDPEFCRQNVRAIVERAREQGVFVCIDMEDSARTERTLEIWRSLHDEFDNVGIVIQAYLYRSEADVAALAEAGATVRLCKGAYKEPADVAFPDKAAVDAAMVRLARLMLEKTASAPAGRKPYLAMATHDEQMIAATKEIVAELEISPEAFEFQMLYGIRRDLQEQLAAEGYRMRAYAPFGTEWYPYYMRRMAERPANVGFVVKALVKETPGAGLLLVLAVIALLWLLRGRKRRR